MKNIFKNLILILAVGIFASSCHDELNQSPIDPDSFTEEDVFATASAAKGALAKLYSSLALTGQSGPAGDPDIADIDEGFSQFSRMLFNLNEITTDHAVVGWGDPGLQDLHGLYWSGSNDFTEAMYYRLAQEVSFCNSFIVNASSLTDPEVATYIAEARFLRAYAYYNLMDLFGNIPLNTEITTELPEQSSRAEIFAFVERELLDVEALLPDSNEYGRVDKVAAQAMLSRLYLNAEVWTGTPRFDDCVTYSNNVMNSSYSIHMVDLNGNETSYDELFLADNDTNGAQNEFIFTLNFDGTNSQTWGGTTFLIHAAIGGSMDPTDFGVNGGWFGTRTTKALVEKFTTDISVPIFSKDKRGMFHTDGQSLEIESLTSFLSGYAVTKFKNVDSNGNPGSDSGGDFTDTDIPLIRLAEIYLNYAEAVLRGGGGSIGTAVDKINELRLRAYGDASGNITAGDLTLEFVIDERSKELYWEGLRRTDLIRYGYFTSGAYMWPWKGNVSNGTSVDNFRNIFPLPTNLLTVNPNLTQNEGY